MCQTKMIEVKNLRFHYRSSGLDVAIFKDFNISVKKGDFVAIKGPSGSGKSTLLYLLAGLLRFQEGQVMIHGRDVSQMSDLELSLLRNQDIGFVFQQFHLLPKSTVLENILLPTTYPIEVRARDEAVQTRAIELANDLGIGDRLDHFPNQLSGGQQQRVAIARALINEPELILADEPTGNLDSKSTQQIIEILKILHRQGKTVVLITHEEEVARAAEKVLFLRDGHIVEERINETVDHKNVGRGRKMQIPPQVSRIESLMKIIPMVARNAFRNRTRSILTMLGITVGVSAVCAMVTLGNFTKAKILDSYSDLGVNTILFRGNINWNLKATDQYPVKFNLFNWEADLLPLKRTFPQVKLVSPIMRSWNTSATFAGKSIDNDVRLVGISEDGLEALGRKVISGKGISSFHVERKSTVCVVGYDIGTQLFGNRSPIDQVIYVSMEHGSFACKVIGLLEERSSNQEWSKPNLQIFLPFTVYQVLSGDWWDSKIKEVSIQLMPGAEVEKVSKAIRNLFEEKYGSSGLFRVDSDSLLLAQMEKFLNLFSILLVSIALVSLTVGGMGIANMMLVSVSERLKEIGIRKSIGATHASIRNQFLLESVFLCFIAGTVGILAGIAAYQSAIYGASLLMPKLTYQWVLDPSAIGLSLVSILTVSILSGLVPALKAEKLQVIDALRSD